MPKRKEVNRKISMRRKNMKGGDRFECFRKCKSNPDRTTWKKCHDDCIKNHPLSSTPVDLKKKYEHRDVPTPEPKPEQPMKRETQSIPKLTGIPPDRPKYVTVYEEHKPSDQRGSGKKNRKRRYKGSKRKRSKRKGSKRKVSKRRTQLRRRMR